jgi:AcrR family transcriptional regulator
MTAEVRSPGRPRNADADAAIVDATLNLLADEGYAGLSMDAVASLAGVGKATIYRRWPGKQQLVIHAVGSCTESLRSVNSGSVRDDLVAITDGIVRMHTTTAAGRILPVMAAEGARNPDLASAYREQIIKPRRAHIAAVLQRGIDRGELRADLDLDVIVDAVVGPAIYRSLVANAGESVPRNWAKRLVDSVLSGIGR